MTDISHNDQERTANMGLIGAIFGLGFIFGPMIGGLLAQFGTTAPFYFVGALAAANTVATFFFLPESNRQKNNNKLSLNPFKTLKTAISDKRLRLRYLIIFLFNAAVAM